MKDEYTDWKRTNHSELMQEFCDDIMQDEFDKFCKSRYDQL